VVDVRPLELGPNQIRRFYRGDSRIAAFRGLPAHGDDAPEDWVASTTTVFGEEELGLSRLDGERLADLFAADSETFFDPRHLAAYGAEPAVLLKLLDAGERLPLHLHPDGRFAAAHLGTSHGKTEAWVILEAEPDALVHVGFSRDRDNGEVAGWVAGQDLAAFLEAMNHLPVRPGDSIFVPAGVPHVIGRGILLLELQEPSDLSLLLEWEGRMREDEAFLGLSREVALRAVTYSAVDPAYLTSNRGASLFPSEADGFFRADVVASGARLEPGFSVLIVTDGEGELRVEHAEPLSIRRGSVVLVPFASGATELTGSLLAIRCRPPATAP
jgi:mannose-6-phosphate isomerase